MPVSIGILHLTILLALLSSLSSCKKMSNRYSAVIYECGGGTETKFRLFKIENASGQVIESPSILQAFTSSNGSSWERNSFATAKGCIQVPAEFTGFISIHHLSNDGANFFVSEEEFGLQNSRLPCNHD